MNQTEKLLNYWYNLEFFSPFWPEKTKDTVYINLVSKRLPWQVVPDFKYKYDIYLGKIKSQDLILSMLEAIGVEDDTIDKDSSQSCICAFKLTHDGKYIPNSFAISTFVWAMAKIISEKNMKVNLNTSDINKFNEEMNDILTAIDNPIECNNLETIYLLVIKKMLLTLNESTFSAVINKKFTKKENTQPKEQNGKEDVEEEDTSTDMLSSFYVADIDMVKHNVHAGDHIIQYIKALHCSSVNRIEIDTDVAHMQHWLSPERYPLGKWPSIHSPSLMQQMAINIAISKDENLSKIFSVNGPPGTGKTTLLKEIIASNVVERALLLAECQKPDEAFQKCQFKSPVNDYLKNYYQLNADLVKYGIIVVSNNNSAVENISKELPIAEDVKKSHTSLFDIEKNEEIYFSDIIKPLHDEKCWGLISARLGKRSNINELKQAIWFNKDGANLQQLFKKKPPSWEQAKEAFKTKFIEVLEYRKWISDIVKTTKQHAGLVAEHNHAKEIVLLAENSLHEQTGLLAQKCKEQNDLIYQIKALEESNKLLYRRLPLYKKIFLFFFRKDPIIVEIKRIGQELDLATIKLTSINLEIPKAEKQLDTLKVNYSVAQENLVEKEAAVLSSNQEIEGYKNHFGGNFAGEAFWSNIEKNEKSQLASPWADKKYDTLREELFYYALMLHKAFILNSKCVKQNLNCLVNLWNNSFAEQDKEMAYSHLLNTLFLVVPVVSTTFASVSTFLKHIGKNELGTLIVDEAGQATPQSALGALWRTRKAIIVGDPLQVEPVVTIPKELSKRFAEEFGIGDEYKSQELSVQVLADSINPYGGYREYSNGKIWLGCPLVLHRRCIDPMFSIANEVAYNNRMFKQSVEPKSDIVLLLKESKWIDIKGKENGDKDHFVPEQGEQVIEMVLNAFALQNGFPSLYIISPFKSVVNNMKAMLKQYLYKHYPEYTKEDIHDWIERCCGTVHTFQGKQENEVIFILGCDNKSGTGAAEWAGKKPNILNVAITRAKYRIAIIGDSAVWKKVSNFDFAYKVLQKN